MEKIEFFDHSKEPQSSVTLGGPCENGSEALGKGKEVFQWSLGFLIFLQRLIFGAKREQFFSVRSEGFSFYFGVQGLRHVRPTMLLCPQRSATVRCATAVGSL